MLSYSTGSSGSGADVDKVREATSIVKYRRPDLALQPSGPHTIDGTQFDEVERGQANYTTEGTTGLPAAGQMDFVDYASNGRAALLSFERWAPGMSWEVSTGRIMAPGELTVYPAPPPAGG